jgi:hypothetical protein
MNKNLIITALLVAVAFQPVSAVSPSTLYASLAQFAVFSIPSSVVKNHKVACATVGVSALLYGGYKWASKQLARYNAQVEPQLDQLVAEVKQLVAQDKYVTIERIEAANGSGDLWLTIKKGKYKFLEGMYPKLIELANIYMERMNDLLRPNMTYDERVIAQYRASEAASEFNKYAFYDVLYKVSARSEKDGWSLNEYGIKVLKVGSDAYNAKRFRLSSDKK